MQKDYKKFIYLAAIVFILALVIFPTHPAKAVDFGISSYLYGSAQQFFIGILNLVFSIIGVVVTFMVKALNYVVNIPVIPQGGVPVVTETWKILRDMANMLFIVILVIAAFATLFDIESFGYRGYDFRSLIVRFLIAAILINFSLIIGQIIIDFIQVLTNTFLNAMGDIAGRLANGVNPMQLVPGVQTGINGLMKSGDFTLTAVVSVVFGILFLSTFGVSVLTAMVFIVARIPILWLLLIVSPLAWIASAFPSTRSYWDKWWHQFIGWNLFLPFFLFFLYLGLLLLAKQGDIVNGLVASANSTPILQGYPIFIQMMLFYFMISIVIGGGTGVAMKASMFSGTGISSVVKWGEGRAKRLPVFGHVEALKKASLAKMNAAGDSRLGALFGNEAGQKQREAQMNRFLNVPGARDKYREEEFKKQKDIIGKVDKEMSHFKELEQAGKVTVDQKFAEATWKADRNSAEGIARRAMLYERGMINGAEFGKDITGWTKKNPFLAQNMLSRAQKGGFKNVKADQLLEMASASGIYKDLGDAKGTAVRRQLYMSLLGDKDIPGIDDAIKKMGKDNVAQAVSLMGGDDTNESNKFKKALAKKRPDIVGKYNMDVANRGRSTPIPASRAFHYVYKEVKGKGAKDISEMSDASWSSTEFQYALKMKMKALSRAKPGVKAGIFVPTGTTPPGGIFNPAATPTTVTGGVVYSNSDILSKPQANLFVKNTAGVERRKGQLSGGEVFKNSLEREVSTSPKKLKILRNL